MTPAMRLGQRRLSSRWNRRGASRRTASRSFNAPQLKPDGRTVCPSSPAARSHGACPRRRAIARHNSTTTAVLQQRQVLDLVDDDAVEIGEPLRQLAVPQPTDSRRRGGQFGEHAGHRVRSDVLGHLEQRARRRPPDAVVARTPVAVRGVAQPYQLAGRDRLRVPGHSAAEQHRPHFGMQRRVAVSPRSGLPASHPRGGRGRTGRGSPTVCGARRRRRTPPPGTSRSRAPPPARRPGRMHRSAPRRPQSVRATTSGTARAGRCAPRPPSTARSSSPTRAVRAPGAPGLRVV